MPHDEKELARRCGLTIDGDKLSPIDRSPPKGPTTSAATGFADDDEPHCPNCKTPMRLCCMTCGYGFTKPEKEAVIKAAVKSARTNPDEPDSFRAIAAALPVWAKADHKTVGKIARGMVSTGEIPQWDKSTGMDGREQRAQQSHDGNNTQTPPSICRWLFDVISPHHPAKLIVDPCAGNGNLAKPWRDNLGAQSVEFEISHGKDFLHHQGVIDCDLAILNPPFEGEYTLAFMQHLLKVVPPNTPIVLICHAEFLFGNFKGTPGHRFWLTAPPITSLAILPRDTFVGVAPPSAIVFFNLPKLEPFYVVPLDYLIRSNAETVTVQCGSPR